MQAETAEQATAQLEPHEQAKVVVSVDGVGKVFPAGRDRQVSALEAIAFEALHGQTLGILGPSGCGKSTLLELICGLSEPSAGTIAVNGRGKGSERTEQCALMFQDDLLLPWRSAASNAALPLELHGVPKAAARVRASQMLEHFGLGQFCDQPPAQLSGGMRQRVAFVRTLLAERPVLLLDEPFGSLDSITRAQMQDWLVGVLQDQPRTTLLVTHDIDEALYCCDRVLVLSGRPGRVRQVIESPRLGSRSDAVASPDFTALRSLALEALA